MREETTELMNVKLGHLCLSQLIPSFNWPNGTQGMKKHVKEMSKNRQKIIKTFGQVHSDNGKARGAVKVSINLRKCSTEGFTVYCFVEPRPAFGFFCAYRITNDVDVKEKKQKTDNNSTPNNNQKTMPYKQKKDNVLWYLQKNTVV